ncbi:tetratricopeptide repeat protein [Pedobacter aquatilis]|uniref:tetratricopeptide repeat protein n=1 Tax=Pedobacter aquatilis TaxID=351343 RepID=UPI0029318ECE|nr:tetratricopeptide repeat protein [Pedobacter aquatilis]
MKALIFTVLTFLSLSVYAQSKNNEELQKMYDEDQSARLSGKIDWKILLKQDSLREQKVYEFIKDGKIITGKDYYNSAMIFQHGRDTIASSMAVKQMRKAIELDPSVNKWLLAAAIDRDLMRRNQPQIYGTQYVKMGQNAKFERYKIDTTKITDEQRKYYNVETLAQQKAKERSMNLIPVSDFNAKSTNIEATITFIKTELKKGNQSEFDVSEDSINSFGYQLMSANKTQEALKIFKLNTELYPTGFNAFDSYGECLMKLGKKDEGLKAYKKSLELNPKNENASKILNEYKM